MMNYLPMIWVVVKMNTVIIEVNWRSFRIKHVLDLRWFIQNQESIFLRLINRQSLNKGNSESWLIKNFHQSINYYSSEQDHLSRPFATYMEADNHEQPASPLSTTPVFIDYGAYKINACMIGEPSRHTSILTSTIEPSIEHKDNLYSDLAQLIVKTHQREVIKEAVDRVLAQLHQTGKNQDFLVADIYGTVNCSQEFAEVFFEHFGANSLRVVPPSIVHLAGSGKFTGVVLDLGETDNASTPIIEGKTKSGLRIVNYVAGRALNVYVSSLYEKIFTRDMSVFRLLKEKYGTFEIANEEKGEETFCLPDGQTILIKPELRKCPQLLFYPQTFGEKQKGQLGIDRLVYNSVKKESTNEQASLLMNNIVLVGGGAQFKGLRQALSDKLLKIDEKYPNANAAVEIQMLISNKAFEGSEVVWKLQEQFGLVTLDSKAYFADKYIPWNFFDKKSSEK